MINVKTDFGAKGDNTDDTDALHAAFEAAYGSWEEPHGGSEGAFRNQSVYFPNGWYIINEPIRLRSVMGAHIFGESRKATIQNNQTGGSIFITNGFMYSKVERLSLSLTGGGEGVCFDMNWDNTGSASLQSNTFADVGMGGGGFGLKIGHGGYMGSEISLLNCYLGSHSVAGLYMGNYNAIAISMIGGNIAQCGKGIWVEAGGGMALTGTGMQLNDVDIHIQNGVQDGWDISGVRTESPNVFLMAQPDSRIVVAGCTQTGGKHFLKDCGSDITVLNSYSGSGVLHGAGKLNVINSRFDNPNWNQWYGSIGSQPSALPVVLASTDMLLTAAQSGTVFVNGDTVTFALPRDTTTPHRVPAGTWFGFTVGSSCLLTIEGYASSYVVGDYLELICLVDGGSVWIPRSMFGTWTPAYDGFSQRKPRGSFP